MPKDVIITPASGLIDFKDIGGASDATIQLDDSGNLNITNAGGTLSIGNTAANVYIGDGTNSVDIIFEQSGKIRALTNKTLTLGQSDSFVNIASPIQFISPDGTKTITTRMLNSDILSFQGGAGELLSLSDSMSGTIFSVNDISGIPSIEVLDTGQIKLAEYGGNVTIGTNTVSQTRLLVQGNNDGYGLDVQKTTGHAVARFYQQNSSFNTDVYINNAVSANSWLLSRRTNGETWWYNDGANPIVMHVSATERLRINQDGVTTTIRSNNTNSIVESVGSNGYGAFYAKGQGTNPSYMFFGSNGVETGRISATNTNIVLFQHGSGATERFRITAEGPVVFGRTYPNNERIGLGGSTSSYTSATSATGIYDDTTISSGQTGGYTTFSQYPSTAAASFTVGQLIHFRANFFTKGVGSTITNQYGYTASGLTQATNNYGFYADMNSQANTWNTYMNGTAQNYFGGSVGIGHNNPSSFYGMDTRLLVVNNQNAATILALGNNSATAAASTQIKMVGGTGNSHTTYALVDNAGAPTASIDFGSAVTNFYLTFSGVPKLTLTPAGDMTVNSVKFSSQGETFKEGNTLLPAAVFGIKSVSADDTEPRDLDFSADGTKMYVLGNAGDDITQYTLSTPWRVSTASTPVTFSIAAQDTSMYGLYVKPDGTAFYTCGSGLSDSVHQYSMTGGVITTAAFVRSFSVTAQETDPQSVCFSTDGTKMYVSGSVGDDINQYNLSTAWDISTAVYNNVLLVNNALGGDTVPQGLCFNSTGTKLWTVGSTYDRVAVYTLSTPWQINTGTFSEAMPIYYVADPTTYTTRYQIAGASGIYVNEAQSRLYISDYDNDAIFEFTLGPSTVVEGEQFNVNTKQFNIANDLTVNGRAHFTSNIATSGGALVVGSLSCNTLTSTSSSTTHSIGTGISTGAVNFATAVTSGTITLGGTAQTGLLTLGRSTATHTMDIGAGVTASGNTKTINLGTAGAAGSTTNINYGSATGTVAHALLGTSLTFNGNTIWHGGNDGAGSGLDADLFDGMNSSLYIYGNGTSGSQSGPGTSWSGTHISQYKSGFWDQSGASWTPDTGWWWGITTAHTSNSSAYLYGGQLIFQNATNPNVYIRTLTGGATPNANPWYKVWHEGVDGAGSGLDADLLDGYHVGTSGSTIPLLSTGNTWSATQTFSAAATSTYNLTASTNIASRPNTVSGFEVQAQGTAGTAGAAVMTFHRPSSYAAFFGLDTDNNWKVGGWSMGAVAYKIWHEGNDGTGTGLDADLLDGSHRDTAYNSYGNGTIPVRHSSGYLYSNYFNCTADTTVTAPQHVAIQTSSDNFIRWQTWAQFKTNIGIAALESTGLGLTGVVGLNTTTNTAAEWAALPVGYARMFGTAVQRGGVGTEGAPDTNYGYFFKMANRDSGSPNGWAGLWASYATTDFYVGRSLDGSTTATWTKLATIDDSLALSIALG